MWRVLVVDDDRGIRELLRVAFELEGYQVMLAADGTQALDALRGAHEAWVVVMDVTMPGMSGLEVCRRLAAEGGAICGHRVVLMTAGMTEREDCPPPAEALLRKPFDLNTMVRLVGSLAGDSAPDREADRIIGPGPLVMEHALPCEVGVAAAPGRG